MQFPNKHGAIWHEFGSNLKSSWTCNSIKRATQGSQALFRPKEGFAVTKCFVLQLEQGTWHLLLLNSNTYRIIKLSLHTEITNFSTTVHYVCNHICVFFVIIFINVE